MSGTDVTGGGVPFIANTPGSNSSSGNVPDKPVPDNEHYALFSDGSGNPAPGGAVWRNIRANDVVPNYAVTVSKTAPNGAQVLYGRGQSITNPALAMAYAGTPPNTTSAVASTVMVGGAQAGDVNTLVWPAVVAPYTSVVGAGTVSRIGTALGADPQIRFEVSANNGTGAVVGSVTITCAGLVYAGAASTIPTTEAEMQALATQALATSRNRDVLITPAGAQHLVWGEPTRFSGTPTFKDVATLFDIVSMVYQSTILVTNPWGFADSIDIYATTNTTSSAINMRVGSA